MWAVPSLLIFALFVVSIASFAPDFVLWRIVSIETVLVLIVGLSVLFLIFHFYQSDDRLNKLTDVAEAIGAGNYSTRSNDYGSDALGKLSLAVNTMAEQIEIAIADFETSQRQIEASKKQLEAQNEELEESKEKLQQQNKELSVVVDRQSKFGGFLARIASMEINVIANAALESLLDMSASQVGLVYLYDQQKRELVCISRKSLDKAFLRTFSVSGSMSGLPSEVMRRKKWVNLEDIDAEALPDLDLGITAAKIRNLYGIPVIFQKRFFGVVIIAGLRSIDASTRQLISNQIDALANAISNATTYSAVQRQSIQLEEANQDLLRAHKQRSEFVANMSHELRTPLNSIIGFSGILLKNRNGALQEGELNRVEKINRNGRHLLSLINDILDLSKVEAGRMDFVFERQDIVPVLRDVVEMLQPQADIKNLDLHCEISHDEVYLETDGHKVKQVLINLVGNAIKFTKEGSVTVRCIKTDGPAPSIRMDVADTGVGIRSESMDMIFQAFSQEDSSTSREFGGTGLGLTISRSMIELLGGTLTVASEGPGKGSTFTVALPVKYGRARGRDQVRETVAVSPSEIPAPVPPREVARVEDGEQGAPREPRAPAENVAPIQELKRLDTSSVSDPNRVQRESHADLKKILPIAPGKKVLVVDDDPDAREFIVQYVKDLGAEYKECGEPDKVMDLAREFRPDIITLDIMMPETNGWEVLGLLKADPDIADIPVVIISMVADRNKAISLGAVEALTKPVLQREFMACLQRTLNSDIVENRKVLVVDDLFEFQELMKSWLEGGNNEVRTASNGREALEVLKAFTPEIIFLDLMMPVMDGLTFLQEFRSNDKYADIPVIVVTAKVLSTAERRWLETRAQKIMVKGEEIFSERFPN